MQPCGSRRCRCREAQPRGDTPAPQGPPGRARCPARPELRGAYGLPGSAEGAEDGRAAFPLLRTACGPTAGFDACRAAACRAVITCPAAAYTAVTCYPPERYLPAALLYPPPRAPPTAAAGT